MNTKTLKRQQLRNNEYYDVQAVFDQLYENAGNNAKFTNLMQIIMSAENIKLAYRNIKNNKGSTTKGTDGRTIRDYERMNEEDFIYYFQSKMMNYNPKSVTKAKWKEKTFRYSLYGRQNNSAVYKAGVGTDMRS